MNIAIFGAGNVGSALGGRLAAAGHTIVYGVRDPGSERARAAVASTGHGAQAVTEAEAASSSDAIILAVPFSAAEDALKAAGDLTGRIILDATNSLKPDLSGLDVPAAGSAGEEIAVLVPGAHVVKIFNTTGFGNMADPVYDGKPSAMFYAGDDAAAKQVAHELAAAVGFEPIDAGSLSNAGLLEAVAMLWIHLAYKGGLGRDFAFDIARR